MATRRRNSAFRPGTQANIRSTILLFIAFAHRFGYEDFPADAGTLMAFGEFLLQSYSATKSVLNALSSVRHFHLDCRFPVEAFADRDLVLWRRALPLTVRTVSSPAEPLTLELLERLCALAETLGRRGLVFSAFMAVLFASMARLSSLLPPSGGGFDVSRHPTLADVSERGGEWSFRVKWAKNLQDAEQGFVVPLLPRRGSVACPARALTYLTKGRGSSSTAGGSPLFSLPGSSGRGGKGETCLSMPVARAWLNMLLVALGKRAGEFSFHSFRRGACTRAFNMGADTGDIMQLGGWRSSAVRAYLPTTEARRRAARLIALP